MSTQVRIVRSRPQSDKDWLPFYHPSQSQSRCCEASDGHHARQPEAKPFCLLPQLHELCGLLCEQQAQPDRTSKPPPPDPPLPEAPNACSQGSALLVCVLSVAQSLLWKFRKWKARMWVLKQDYFLVALLFIVALMHGMPVLEKSV